jgi:hypothetical protein
MFVENTRAKTRSFLKEKGRSLDLVRFDYLFGDETGKHVLEELSKYQNEDGGFGKKLVPEIVYEASSPISTAVAFRILDEIKVDARGIAFKAFAYLKEHFDEEYFGWKPLPEEAVPYEQSLWWDGTLAFRWGVPTMEILAYFHKYKEPFDKLSALTEKAVSYINESESLRIDEVFAALKFYESVDQNIRAKIADKLKEHVFKHISFKMNDWEEYGTLPALFVHTKDSFLYNELEPYINASLSYLIDTMNDDGVWMPDWRSVDSDDQDESTARSEAARAGDMTVRYTYLLREFAFIY